MTTAIRLETKFALIPDWVIDLDISSTAFKLYAALARYADNQTHRAFPSRETLAERLKCSVKTVERAVTELEMAGAIRKESRGRYQSNVYTLVMVNPDRTKMSIDETEMSVEGTKMSVRMDKNVALTRTTELEPEELEPLNTQASVNESFNQFWDIYPKHLQKGEARKAFFKAVQRQGDADTILEGARRMAADPNLPVKQFIPYPATWLNRDGWDDEPFPAREGLGIPGVSKSPHVGGPREWVKDMHDLGEHWECRPGEFGCK